MQNKAALGIALALGATIFYGQVPVMARLAFLNGIPAVESVLLRTYVIAIVFAAVAAIKHEPIKFTLRALPSFLAQCMATLSVSACYLLSLQYIPVNLAVVIFFAFPIIVLVAAPLVEGHAPTLSRVLVAILAFMGIGISIGLNLGSVSTIGLSLAALSAFGCAFQFFSGRTLSRYMSPIATSSLVHITILPFVFALAYWLQDGDFAVINSPAVTTIGVLAMLGVALGYLGGYFLHMSGLAAAPSSTVVPFFNLEPVVSTVMAGLILNETLAVNQMIGGGIVLFALVLCGIIESRQQYA